jgi:hypothetical protein
LGIIGVDAKAVLNSSRTVTTIRSQRWACPEVFGEPHQVAIRILNEEFTLSALIVTDPIPSFVWFLIERPFSTV